MTVRVRILSGEGCAPQAVAEPLALVNKGSRSIGTPISRLAPLSQKPQALVNKVL